MSRSTPGFPISHFLIHYPSATTYLIFSFCCRSHLKFSYSQTLRDWNSEKCFPNILLMAWHLFIWCYFTLVCRCIANLSEKAMAPHSNTLAWKITWRRSLVGCSPWGHWGSDTTEPLHFHFSLSCIGEGNGNPLQYSCLENPKDRGAWWAAVYGVTQSWTWLKWLSSSS